MLPKLDGQLVNSGWLESCRDFKEKAGVAALAAINRRGAVTRQGKSHAEIPGQIDRRFDRYCLGADALLNYPGQRAIAPFWRSWVAPYPGPARQNQCTAPAAKLGAWALPDAPFSLLIGTRGFFSRPDALSRAAVCAAFISTLDGADGRLRSSARERGLG